MFLYLQLIYISINYIYYIFMTRFYIPWFGNYQDAIIQNHPELWTQKTEIIQKNSCREWLKLNNNTLKWVTRSIESTISFTIKAISNILEDNKNTNNSIYWHSQWWLLVCESLIQQPELLDYFDYIELLAPVSNYEVWSRFHKWKNDTYYMEWKKILVRKKYIQDLKDKSKWNNNTLHDFLDLLNKRKWKWTIKLTLWESDKIIKLDELNIKELLKKYPKITIDIISQWDHYLWYKKQKNTK